MARIVRDHRLESRSARAKLKDDKPCWLRVQPGLYLGYRKPKGKGPGSWLARKYDPDKGYARHTLKAPNGASLLADDFSDADGVAVLDFAQAQQAALALGDMAAIAGQGKGVTVKEAVERYKTNLQARNGDPMNAIRVFKHMPDDLARTLVCALTSNDFERKGGWNERLAKLTPSSINRTNAAFKAALNLAAGKDKRIRERPWETALIHLADADEARNVILTDDEVRMIVKEAQADPDADFSLFVETVARTGQRPSQLGALTVADLQDELDAPRLMMPPSRKGNTAGKSRTRYPVPIPADLALRLRARVKQRAASDRLFLIIKRIAGVTGGKYYGGIYNDRFNALIARLDRKLEARGEQTMTQKDVTLYALRHSSIVRDLKARVPTAIVAKKHDTSDRMIQKHYAAFIADHADAMLRAAMLPDEAAGAKIVPMRKKAS